MGPIILLDKSALQMLNTEETLFLYKHYYVVIAPIIILEILADLKKIDPTGALSQADVIRLARRLHPSDSKINLHFHDLCIGDLLGYAAEMTERPIIDAGTPFTAADGTQGIHFEEQPERKIIRDWQDGNFNQMEEDFSREWREAIEAINLEQPSNEYRRLIKERLGKLPPVKNLNALKLHILSALRDPKYTKSHLQTFISQLQISDEISKRIFERWEQMGQPLFEKFAPYAFYCYSIRMLFDTGMAFNLIGTRKTNVIDLQYLFYLPFCMVFTSNDNLHKNLTTPLLNEKQTFVDAGELKKDLARISARWNALTQGEKKADAKEYGCYPPPKPTSITHQLWVKYMKPWKPGSGNLAIDMTPEEHKRVVDLIRRLQPKTEE